MKIFEWYFIINFNITEEIKKNKYRNNVITTPILQLEDYSIIFHGTKP